MSKSGFTTIELLAVLLIIGILSTAAWPSYRNMLVDTRVTSLVNEFTGSLHRAREKAITTHNRVTVCRSKNGIDCYTGESWSDGWIMFPDRSNYGTRDADEEIFSFHNDVNHYAQMTGNRPVKNYVSYTGNGVARYKTGGFQAGTVTIQVKHEIRKVILSSGGRIRINRISD